MDSVDCDKCPVSLDCSSRYVAYGLPDECPLYRILMKSEKDKND